MYGLLEVGWTHWSFNPIMSSQNYGRECGCERTMTFLTVLTPLLSSEVFSLKRTICTTVMVACYVGASQWKQPHHTAYMSSIHVMIHFPRNHVFLHNHVIASISSPNTDPSAPTFGPCGADCLGEGQERSAIACREKRG
jgi:hypothetical protein